MKRREADQGEKELLCLAAAAVERWPLRRCRATLDKLAAQMIEAHRGLSVSVQLQTLRFEKPYSRFLFFKILDLMSGRNRTRLRHYWTLCKLSAALERAAQPPACLDKHSPATPPRTATR